MLQIKISASQKYVPGAQAIKYSANKNIRGKNNTQNILYCFDTSKCFHIHFHWNHTQR
jgi:hypothetical protein